MVGAGVFLVGEMSKKIVFSYSGDISSITYFHIFISDNQLIFLLYPEHLLSGCHSNSEEATIPRLLPHHPSNCGGLFLRGICRMSVENARVWRKSEADQRTS